MTAMWASPIVRRTCSPVARALEPDGRLLLEHPLERRAHLVEVALGLRLDGDHERRRRELERRQRRAASPSSQRVAGLGHGQLGDRADLAGLAARRSAPAPCRGAAAAGRSARPRRGSRSRRGPASGACPDRTRR